MESSGIELQIADWRRRVSELYAEVRRVAAHDAPAAHELWCAVRERLYREHAASPVAPGERDGFRARHFPYDPALRFEVAVLPPAAAEEPPVALPFSLPLSTQFSRIGRVEVPFDAGARGLVVFWLNEYSGGIFLPFRDATNTHETYGAGRYLLDTAKGADLGPGPSAGSIVLDFNFAFQPSCAFDPRWACPLAPPENRLDFDVRAGERIA